jgi:hypothetical protein
MGDQRFFQKTAVQVAIVLGGCLVLAACVSAWALARGSRATGAAATSVTATADARRGRTAKPDPVDAALELTALHMQVVRGVTALDGHGTPLDAAAKEAIEKRLAALTFDGASVAQLASAEEVRASALQLLRSPGAGGFERGWNEARSSVQVMGLLADHALCGETVRAHGYPDSMAESVDAHWKLAKAVLLIAAKVDVTAVGRAPLPVRQFVEAFAVLSTLDVNAPTRPQGPTRLAILAITKEDLSDLPDAQALRKLHAGLLDLCVEPDDVKVAKVLAAFPFLLRDYGISDRQLEAAGAPDPFVRVAGTMRRLFE